MWNPLRIFREHDHHWHELDKALTEAFEKIKSEKKLTFSWLNYLRKKDLENEKLQQDVQFELGKHNAEIEFLKNEIKELKNDVKTAKISPFPDQIRTKSEPESEPVSEPTYQNRFVKRIVAMIRPQRKEFVMQKILDFVDKGGYTTKQIETVIVAEKQLCGRTAFYDYMRELKERELIKTEQKRGRKVLIST